MAIPLAPSNPRQDSIARAGPNQKRATISINPIAVSGRTFSLGHVLMGYAFGAANRIAYGDRHGGDKDGRKGVRSAVRPGGCCAAKTTPYNKTFALRVLQHPAKLVC